MMKSKNLLFTLMLLLSFYSNPINAQCTEGDIILNGSFETGDFTDWTVMDLANPWFPQGVFCGPFDTFGFLEITALDGSCFAGNGFDGEGPGQITHHQTVTIPANSTATLNFSYWVAYDLTFGATIDRMFEVQIQPVGGGTPLGIPYSFSAIANTFENGTGWIPITVDLSAFAGQTVWLCFVETIPENFTGPAQLGLDAVSLDIVCSVCEDPCANNTGGTLPCTYDPDYNVCDDSCEFTTDTFNDATCECEFVLTIPDCDDGNPDTSDMYNEASCQCVNTFLDEVPTVGEWGLIILGLLLSITAIVGIRQKIFAIETR